MPKEEGEVEEPQTSTLEQAWFDWAHIWMEEGGSPALQRVSLKRLIAQVFSFESLSHLFCLTLYLSIFAHVYIWATWSSFCSFSRGCTKLHQASFLLWEVEHLETKGFHQVVCGGQIGGQGPVQHPLRHHDLATAFHVCWPASAQEAQVGTYCNGLVPYSPRGCSYLTCPPTPRGDIPTEMTPLCVNIRDAHWLCCCQVKGAWRDLAPPMSPSVLMCITPISAQSCHVCFAPLHSLIPMPSDGMASGHITLDLQTLLKECYTSIYKKELCHSWICM